MWPSHSPWLSSISTTWIGLPHLIYTLRSKVSPRFHQLSKTKLGLSHAPSTACSMREGERGQWCSACMLQHARQFERKRESVWARVLGKKIHRKRIHHVPTYYWRTRLVCEQGMLLLKTKIPMFHWLFKKRAISWKWNWQWQIASSRRLTTKLDHSSILVIVARLEQQLGRVFTQIPHACRLQSSIQAKLVDDE
jgi:hypothetical protein